MKKLTVKQQIRKSSKKELWDKYCGFLDLNIDEFMKIQKEEMNKQLSIWCNSKIGKAFTNDKKIKNINEFRKKIPLTTYDDYANYLLKREDKNIPKKSEIWIQTTWEGGLKPVKFAPYTREMLDVFRDNIISCLILSSSNEKYDFKFKHNDKMLYGLAPLPFLTGLVPFSLSECSDVEFFPPVEKAANMTFSDRNSLGFKMAMEQDVELFFGLGSVAYAVSQKLGEKSDRKIKFKDVLSFKTKMAMRYLKAKKVCKKENRTLLPKDLFNLKCFMVAGTDNKCYKEDLEKMWGTKPLELFAGTEMSLIGTETHNRNGLYLFPKTCFYEFIKLEDVLNNKIHNTPITKAYLTNEVEKGKKYELVVSTLQGGAFVRYRTGDIYKCIDLKDDENGVNLPRFDYIDRIPWIIDVAGFSRFNEKEIDKVIKQSELKITDYFATKDFDEFNKPFLHLYVETDDSNVNEEEYYTKMDSAFMQIDGDYYGLKKIIGANPLKLTFLQKGTISKTKSRKVNYMKVDSFNNYYKKRLEV